MRQLYFFMKEALQILMGLFWDVEIFIDTMILINKIFSFKSKLIQIY